ncbi:hypothetical protein GCM10010095_05230 [Streptomyces anthocyanicus]|nr:hypothetical protein GCM10010095_05230 [Streptomyces anthocyanicus]
MRHEPPTRKWPRTGHVTQRTDEYGGSLGNRMRLPPARGPRGAGGVPGRQAVLFRITATDWVEGGTTIEESAVRSGAGSRGR